MTGINPYNALKADERLIKNKEGKLDFTSKDKWGDISEEAIDLVKKMTIRNPYQRLTIKKCLKHKWFTDIISHRKILKSALERFNKENIIEE